MKTLRIDPFKYVNLKTVSAGYFGSLVAAWVYSPPLVGGLAIIGGGLLLAGEWYAREIYRQPIPDTYLSVVIGWIITGIGITLTHAWIITCGVSPWLHLLVWVWCVALTGGPMISWQRRKRDEQARRVRRAVERFENKRPGKK